MPNPDSLTIEGADICRCGGSGKLDYEHVDRDARGNEIGHTRGSHPCPCRQALEPREGEARWWTLETVWHRVWTACTKLYTAEITVDAEVPYSADNYKLQRRGNRYHPTMIAIDIEGGRCFTTEDARELALVLLAAAEHADAIDDADTAPCGHWAPCDCETESP